MMEAPDEVAYKDAVRRNYRHEVAALWLVDMAAQALSTSDGPIQQGGGRLETLAVAGHHKYLADGYLFDDQRFEQPLTWDDAWSAVKAACELARAMFQQQGWIFPLRNLDRLQLIRQVTHDPLTGVNPPYDWLVKTRDDLLLNRAARGGYLRDLFTLLKGLLMTSDWMASGAQGGDEALDALKGVVRVRPGTLKEHLRERIERRRRDRPDLELKPFRGYTHFQSACAAAEGHVVAVAPTGSGKTEASWLWALGQVERGQARKVIILLPTMVTANSIHDRLCSFFSAHGHEVGLVHSTSDLVRQMTATGDDEADRADVRADHLSETHLFRPVTAGTVDQLLVPLFHAGRWAMKTMAAADSAIVIDEIHAYDPHTLGLIVLMIKRLAPLGARFMIMSATLPEALKSVVHAALTSPEAGAPSVSPVEDSDLLDSARNSWESADNPLSEWLFRTDEKGRPVPSPEFLDLWGRRNDRGEPLKILVVVNTVKRCQGLTRALREFGFELVCYHSKFIFEDRRTKERRINDRPPRLLLATQVVEVSLDIDYDVLLTECAPIDALVQRAGRVNRARRGSLGRVVVHPYEIGSEIVYGLPRGVLDATWESCRTCCAPPTERDLIAMVEEVYAGLPRADSQEFDDIQAAVRNVQNRLGGVLDAPRPREEDAQLKTRKEDYTQISVIPECFREVALSCHPRDRKRYELKVPVWYARKHQVATDDLPICPMSYSPEIGAELLATHEHPEPGHEIF